MHVDHYQLDRDVTLPKAFPKQSSEAGTKKEKSNPPEPIPIGWDSLGNRFLEGSRTSK